MAVLAAGPAVAQRATASTSSAAFGIVAHDGVGAPMVRSLPANTAITDVTTFYANSGGVAGGELTFGPSYSRTGGSGLWVIEKASVSAAGALAGTTTNQSVTLPHELLLTIPAATAGKLCIRFSGIQSGGAVANAAVVVNTVGVWSSTMDTYQHTRELDHPAGPATTVRVTIFGRCAAVTSASYWMHLEVWFEPGATHRLNSYAQGCDAGLGGAFLFRHDELTLWVDNVRRQPAAGLLVVGVAPVQLPLPGTHCSLVVAPAVALPFTTSAQGGYQLTTPIPNGLLGDVYFQALMLTGATPQLSATNGMLLECR